MLNRQHPHSILNLSVHKQTMTEPNLLTASIAGLSTWKYIPRLSLNNIAECLGEDCIKWKILNRTTHSSVVLNEITCGIFKTYDHRARAFRRVERIERFKRDLHTIHLSHLSIELDAISDLHPTHHSCVEKAIHYMAENSRRYPLKSIDNPCSTAYNNIVRGNVLIQLFRESPCQQSYFKNKPIRERTSDKRLLYLYIALIYLEWNRRDPNICNDDLSIYVDQLTGRRVSTGRANKRKYRIVDERALHLAQYQLIQINRIRTLGLENAIHILQKYTC